MNNEYTRRRNKFHIPPHKVEEMIEVEKQEIEAIPVIMEKERKLKACPRCGKTGRGLYFHIRNCKA